MPASSNRSPSGRWYAWAAIITRLRRTPNVWQREFTGVPARLESHVRLRRHPDLRTDDGVLEAELVNEHPDENGKRRGDLYLRWVPNPPQGAKLAPQHITCTPDKGEKGHHHGEGKP